MKKILITCLIAYCSYSCSPVSKMQKSGNYITAIDNTITDYTKSRFSKNSNIFSVLIMYTKDSIMEICFFPEKKMILSLLPNDTIGAPNYPIKYIEKDGKLFYWYENGYHLTAEAISALAKYGAMVWPSEKYNWLLDHDCFQQYDTPNKGPIYYICSNNYNKYIKKIINFYIPNAPPKLRCK